MKMKANNLHPIKGLAVLCTLQLCLSTSLYAQYELDDINLESHRRHYNSLPSVEENDALLRSSSQFEPFLKEAEEIVTRYELESFVGLRLVHRHFALDANQVMAEGYEVIDQTPSLVTQTHQLEEAEEKGAIPASWIFSASQQDEAALFEASTDSAVKAGSKQIQKSPDFFEEMRKSLNEYELNNLLSVAILKRDTLVAEEGQHYREINSDNEHKSIVQTWDSNDESQDTIRTSWSFKGPRQQKCWPILKCVWVPGHPKGEHRYLQVDHKYIKDN